MILIIQCSMTKSNLPIGKARDIYTGQVFKLALKYAEKFGLTPLILSGKYGLIEPDYIIENYDLMSPEFDGPWPSTPGWWVGGKTYFKNAPEHINPLITGHRGYGDMKNWLGKMINGPI